MEAISNSMRKEFEYRVYYLLEKDGVIDGYTQEETELLITRQTDYVIKYGIKDELLAVKFIELSFRYEEMREENFSNTLSALFEDIGDESEKIERLIEHLN